jgi:endonuclease-3 related protein
VGYFNVKAKRLRAFCDGYLEAGGLQRMSRMGTRELRERLLAIHGIGPETADDMLLYAFGRPVFVVDAYTRRLLTRLGALSGGEGYEAIRRGLERSLAPDNRLFNEFHALIVRHGKAVCRPRPLCEDCCLRSSCPYASDPDRPEPR